ncbi:unnamed protein product [Camellia sinensis]
MRGRQRERKGDREGRTSKPIVELLSDRRSATAVRDDDELRTPPPSRLLFDPGKREFGSCVWFDLGST